MKKLKLKDKSDVEYVYNLKLTEKQAKVLSRTCDAYSRLICGQDREYQDLFEAAWEKDVKKLLVE